LEFGVWGVGFADRGVVIHASVLFIWLCCEGGAVLVGCCLLLLSLRLLLEPGLLARNILGQVLLFGGRGMGLRVEE
jgi:hypothetical protein